jgi:chromosome segregation ATPase
MALCRTLTRVAVIGGVATGAAVVIAGPSRVSALFSQARETVGQTIDNVIDDPVALRSQLRQLESQYPSRIGEVRGQLAEINDQATRLEREKQIADRVVALASTDLAEMQGLLEKAQAAREQSPSAIITVRFDSAPGGAVPLDEAYSRAAQLSATVEAYRSRADQAGTNLAFLHEQSDRMGALLEKLEGERAALQAQLWQLNGEIDMIARNDKIIEMTERRQEALANLERYDAVSLDQVRGRLNKIRAEQEARLESLMGDRATANYEDQAKAMLASESIAKRLFDESKARTLPTPDTSTIEIQRDTSDEEVADKVAASVVIR